MTTRTAVRKPVYKSLYFWVVLAIVAGALLGHFMPYVKGPMFDSTSLKPLGDGFVKLIKMITAPIIFCTVVSGIASMQSMKAVGKVGGYALLYFEVISTLALVIGLIVINVVHPGVGMDTSHISADDLKQVDTYKSAAETQSTIMFLMNIIPASFVGAFTGESLLPVLLIAVMFGFALHRLGEFGKPILEFINRIAKVFFNIITQIMYVAPLGALGAMAFTVGKFGIGSLVNLGQLLACFYITCLAFVFIVLGAVAKAHGFSIFRFVSYIREELLIVLGTSSSESALPRMLAKMEHLGADKTVVGLVIPTGYSFNLDGTSIYLTMAAVFIAQATNTPMDLTAQIALLAVLLVSSKGAAGVTGSGFITLAATMSAVGGLPMTGLALILGVDRFMSEGRALTNLVGNGVASLVVAKWVGQLDEAKLARELKAGPAVEEALEKTPAAGV